MRETSAGSNWAYSPNGGARLVRRVLLLCVQPTPESSFGDVLDVDAAATIRHSGERIELKSRRPSKLC